MYNELDIMCANYLIKGAIEGKQGMYRCYDCPLWKNGMCERIFSEGERDEDLLREALELMGGVK